MKVKKCDGKKINSSTQSKKVVKMHKLKLHFYGFEEQGIQDGKVVFMKDNLKSLDILEVKVTNEVLTMRKRPESIHYRNFVVKARIDHDNENALAANELTYKARVAALKPLTVRRSSKWISQRKAEYIKSRDRANDSIKRNNATRFNFHGLRLVQFKSRKRCPCEGFRLETHSRYVREDMPDIEGTKGVVDCSREPQGFIEDDTKVNKISENSTTEVAKLSNHAHSLSREELKEVKRAGAGLIPSEARLACAQARENIFAHKRRMEFWRKEKELTNEEKQQIHNAGIGKLPAAAVAARIKARDDIKRQKPCRRFFGGWKSAGIDIDIPYLFTMSKNQIPGTRGQGRFITGHNGYLMFDEGKFKDITVYALPPMFIQKDAARASASAALASVDGARSAMHAWSIAVVLMSIGHGINQHAMDYKKDYEMIQWRIDVGLEAQPESSKDIILGKVKESIQRLYPSDESARKREMFTLHGRSEFVDSLNPIAHHIEQRKRIENENRWMEKIRISAESMHSKRLLPVVVNQKNSPPPLSFKALLKKKSFGSISNSSRTNCNSLSNLSSTRTSKVDRIAANEALRSRVSSLMLSRSFGSDGSANNVTLARGSLRQQVNFIINKELQK